MRINKFKLIDDGRTGIEIDADEFLRSGSYHIIDIVKRKRSLPVAKDLLQEINKLKYYLLNLTGHWIGVYTQYYDADQFNIKPILSEPTKAQITLKELWNKTKIIGAKSISSGFIITAKMETVEGKFLILNTPFITADDDIGFYEECMEVLHNIGDMIGSEISKAIIPIEEEAQKRKSTSDLSDNELVQMVADEFADRGFIIMMDGVSSLSDGEIEKPKTVLHANTRNIDGDNLTEAQNDEEDRGKEDTQEPETAPEDAAVRQPEKVNPYGPPASEKEFPADLSSDVPLPRKEETYAPEDLSRLEHSESMGELPDPEKEDSWS